MDVIRVEKAQIKQAAGVLLPVVLRISIVPGVLSRCARPRKASRMVLRVHHPICLAIRADLRQR